MSLDKPRRLPAIVAELCAVIDTGAWVYFISEEDGPIKIGYARRVGDRLRGSQTGNPRPLRLVGAVFVDEGKYVMRGDLPTNAKRMEKDLHVRFASLRIRGEWFLPGDELIEYIASLHVVAATVGVS